MPIIFIAFVVFTKITEGPAFGPYVVSVSEDGTIENLSVIFYLITFIFSLIIAKIFFNNGKKTFGFLYLAMAIVFIFIAIEEISWAQRILNIPTTGFFSESTQNEINIHDLEQLAIFEDPSFIIAGFIGGLLWIVFPKSKSTNVYSFRRFFVPGWYLMSYFIPVSIFYLILNLTPADQISIGLYWNFLIQPDQEIFEFLLSLGFMGFILINFIRQIKISRKK